MAVSLERKFSTQLVTDTQWVKGDNVCHPKIWDVDSYRLVNFRNSRLGRSSENQVQVTICKRIFAFVRKISIFKGILLTVSRLPSESVEKVWT